MHVCIRAVARRRSARNLARASTSSWTIRATAWSRPPRFDEPGIFDGRFHAEVRTADAAAGEWELAVPLCATDVSIHAEPPAPYLCGDADGGGDIAGKHALAVLQRRVGWTFCMAFCSSMLRARRNPWTGLDRWGGAEQCSVDRETRLGYPIRLRGEGVRRVEALIADRERCPNAGVFRCIVEATVARRSAARMRRWTRCEGEVTPKSPPTTRS
jgi:hypothetical protein